MCLFWSFFRDCWAVRRLDLDTGGMDTGGTLSPLASDCTILYMSRFMYAGGLCSTRIYIRNAHALEGDAAGAGSELSVSRPAPSVSLCPQATGAAVIGVLDGLVELLCRELG